MYSLYVAALDAPQTLPRAAQAFYQDGEWYERQQAMGLPPNIVFGPDVRSYAGIVFSPVCHYDQAQPKRNLVAQLRSLQQHYTILGSDHLITEVLEGESALSALLIEAVRHLKNAFGEPRIIQVRAQFSDDETMLKVAVQLPADFEEDPEQALASFDEEWWLSNCQRSGGALVFDYEIQDAV
jgi:hypothetical protein